VRLRNGFLGAGVALVLVVAGVLGSPASAFAETKTETFLAKTASEQEFQVPPGVSQIEVTAVGGAGKPGDLCEDEGAPHYYAGGAGAKVTATLAVSEGKALYVDFGGGGTGGAEANCASAEGGGASDVRAEQGELKSRLVVAGGGGGGGGSFSYQTSGRRCEEAGTGGSANALEGEAGADGRVELGCGFGRDRLEGTGGGGGKEGAGGDGGAQDGTICPGTTGSEGVGGNGGPQSPNNCGNGGGGGGGYYGGGGGGGGGGGAGGGGAGSSYYAPGATNTSVNADTTDPQEVLITYTVPPVPGPTGPTGPEGPTGPQGVSGATGATGPTGSTGETGATGQSGATGATGGAGPRGVTGATGPQGATGAAGSTGSNGADGATGAAGATGPTGPSGPAGATGKNGATGASGANGSSGPAGATGATGPTGKEGVKGATGNPGATGGIGATGPAGKATVAYFASAAAYWKEASSGACLYFTQIAGQGAGACPAKASTFPISDLLTGPMPADGAVVSNLYAETNATLSGKETASAAVIDNATGATLLSCTVNSTSKSYCSNTGESAPMTPGQRIEVKVTGSSSYCENKAWQVSFRY
jgi:collagen type VII alpha